MNDLAALFGVSGKDLANQKKMQRERAREKRQAKKKRKRNLSNKVSAIRCRCG